MTVDRTRRIGENEALFRAVNERIHDVSEGFADVLPRFEIVCECGDVSCDVRISMPVDEYRALRASPERFAMLDGHEKPDVEDVVGGGAGYIVVEKREGRPADLARADAD